MDKHNRRTFLQTSVSVLATSMTPAAIAALKTEVSTRQLATAGGVHTAPMVPSNEGKKPLRLGLIIGIGKDPHAAMAKVRDLGVPRARYLSTISGRGWRRDFDKR